MVVLKETLQDMEDRIVEGDIEVIDIMITIEAETGQEKGYLQEIVIVAGIEVQVTVDPGQAPELAQTEIGLDVIIVESMTILQEIVLILGKRERAGKVATDVDMEAEEQTYRQDSPIENHRGPLNL